MSRFKAISKFRLFLLAAVMFLLALCGMTACSKTPAEQIVLHFDGDEGVSYDAGKKEITVEYAYNFFLPDAYVADKNNKRLEEYDVEVKLYEGNGEEIPLVGNLLLLDTGVYKLVFTAGNGSSALPLETKLTVEDARAPEVVISSLFIDKGVEGDEIVLPTFRTSDRSGVDNSATEVRVVKDGSLINTENGFFTASVGVYNLEIYVKDVVGNEKTYVFPIEISERYIDSSLKDKQLMTFDTDDYEKSVKPLYSSCEGAHYRFVTEDLPTSDGEYAPSGGMYKIESPDLGEHKILFINNRSLNTEKDSVGNIVIRLYMDELIENLKILDRSGKELCAWNFLIEGWYELEFSAMSKVGWENDFGDFVLDIFNEDAVNIYIDEVFYTTRWRDSDLQEGFVVNFDKAEYIDYVSQNHFSNMAVHEILTPGDAGIPEGAHEGVLKVTLRQSFDGFSIDFDRPVSLKEIIGFRVRMYFGKLNLGGVAVSSRSGVVMNNGKISGAQWGDNYSSSFGHLESGWKNYYYNAVGLRDQMSGNDTDLITSYYFALVDGTASSEPFYVDEIECYFASDVETDLPGETEDGNGLIADFTLEDYESNVFVSVALGTSWNQTFLPKTYGYEEFYDKDGNKNRGLKVERSDNRGYEGVEYILPQYLPLCDQSHNPLAGKLVIRAYFNSSMTVNASYGVRDERGKYSAVGNSARPQRYKTTVSSGWNEFEIDVQGLLTEEISEISAIYFLTSYYSNVAEDNIYYIDKITFTPYIPPYLDDDFLASYKEDYLLLADFEETEYLRNLSVSSYASQKPDAYDLKECELDGTVYNVLKIVPSAGAYNGFDLVFASEVSLGTVQNPAANYIYFKIYSPVAVTANVNPAVMKGVGDYSRWGEYTTPKRIVVGLNKGWNIVKIDIPQLLSENVNSITGIALTFNPVYAGGIREEDKAFYIDTVYMDRDYSEDRLTILLSEPKIEAEKSGSDLVIRWDRQEKAQKYLVSVNNGEAQEVVDFVYRIKNYDSSQDYFVSVTVKRAGSEDQVANVFFDSRAYKYNASYDAFPVALFDSVLYNGTMKQAPEEPHGLEMSDAIFSATDSGMSIRAFGKNSAPEIKSGFMYEFPFALPANAKTLSFKLAFEAWGVSHYSNSFIGLTDENGKCYNVSSCVRLKGNDPLFAVSDGYIAHYNQKDPIFIIDIEKFYQSNPKVGAIKGLYFGQNKSTQFKLEYIVYSDGSTELATPKIDVVRTAEGMKVFWTEAEGAESYEVLIDGLPCTEYVSGTSFVLSTSGVVSVQAKSNSADYRDSSIASMFVDASFLKKRDDNTVWLSDFNHAGTASEVVSLPLNPWNGNTGVEMSVGYSSSFDSGYGTVSGVTFKPQQWNYSAIRYNLPKAVSLAEMSKLVMILGGNTWMGSSPMFFMLSMGEKRINVTQYMSYNGSIKEENQSPIGQGTLEKNFRSLCVSLDINALLENQSFDLTEIDGIIIGHGNGGMTFCLDGIYFYPSLKDTDSTSANQRSWITVAPKKEVFSAFTDETAYEE